MKRSGWHVGDPIKIERRGIRVTRESAGHVLQSSLSKDQWVVGGYACFQHALSDIDGRSDRSQVACVAPNVTFGSNRSVKNGVKERANESTRVVNSRRRDEISIDPPRGSEIPKWGRREVRDRGRKRGRDERKRDRETLISGFTK